MLARFASFVFGRVLRLVLVVLARGHSGNVSLFESCLLIVLRRLHEVYPFYLSRGLCAVLMLITGGYRGKMR